MLFFAKYINEVVGYCIERKDFNPILNTTLENAIISAVVEKTGALGIFLLINNNLLKWFHENTDLADMGTFVTNIYP